jgi:hypothetical protein
VVHVSLLFEADSEGLGLEQGGEEGPMALVVIDLQLRTRHGLFNAGTAVLSTWLKTLSRVELAKASSSYYMIDSTSQFWPRIPLSRMRAPSIFVEMLYP